MKPLEKNYKRIVVKIGSSLFCSGKKRIDTSAPPKAGFSINPERNPVFRQQCRRIDFDLLRGITNQISVLVKEKKEIVIVSSGAIALGMSVLGLESRPKELSYLQAIAAIGQNELMNNYRDFFKKNGINCGQVLLTWEDFDNRKRYLNAKNTLLTLLKLKAVPVINENDTISTEEIKFGDNDQLSALVSILVNADLLAILSDVDGLLEKDKLTVVNVVDEITPRIKALASSTNKHTSVGGMLTKIEAAKISVESNIPCVIANGRRPDILSTIAYCPQESGTIFLPKKGYLAAKERWIAFGAKPKGKVIVDEGAKKALVNNKSLLSVGVRGVEGNFECGDIVSISDEQGNAFARGRVYVSCGQLDKVKGSRSEKEVIHCDNIVIL